MTLAAGLVLLTLVLGATLGFEAGYATGYDAAPVLETPRFCLDTPKVNVQRLPPRRP